MGWASGSELADELWNDLRSLIPEANRAKAADAIVEHFENFDCDTLYELEDPDIQAAVTRAHGTEG